MAPLTDLRLHLSIAGVLLVGLGAVHLLLPRTLQWEAELRGLSIRNRQVSYVHCYFIGLSCVMWGLLPIAAGPALLEPNPVTRLVLAGAVVFWSSRLVIQLAVFNRHAFDSPPWCALSVAGTGLWLYLTIIWGGALLTQL